MRALIRSPVLELEHPLRARCAFVAVRLNCGEVGTSARCDGLVAGTSLRAIAAFKARAAHNIVSYVVTKSRGTGEDGQDLPRDIDLNGYP